MQKRVDKTARQASGAGAKPHDRNNKQASNLSPSIESRTNTIPKYSPLVILRTHWKSLLAAIWSLLVLIISLYFSGQAKEAAYQANKNASAANQLAQQANDLANKFGVVQAESQFQQIFDSFMETDDELREWEKSLKLKRDGIAPQSAEELEGLLECSGVEIPSTIQKLYKRRQVKYETLEHMVESYRPFHKRFSQLDLKMPAEPQLPWRLPLIKTLPLSDLKCNIAGFVSDCSQFIKEEALSLDNLIGPESRHINIPKSFNMRKIPFKFYITECGVLFDIELLDKYGNTICKIEKNKLKLINSQLPFANDTDKLEIIDPAGIPLFQVYVDVANNMISIGGIFYSVNGERIIALPEKLVTNEFIIQGSAYNPSRRLSMASFIIMPSEDAVRNELRDLKPWFIYSEKPYLDQQRFNEAKAKFMTRLKAFQE